MKMPKRGKTNMKIKGRHNRKRELALENKVF